MVACFVLLQAVPATAETQLILVPAPNLIPNDTYANAWGAAGNANNVTPLCGPNGRGWTLHNGALARCKSDGQPQHITLGGDSADAYAEAKIVNGTATVNAWVTVPKPTVFAAGAAYAKANASIPGVDAEGKLFGLNLSYLTKGNLKLSGQAEPVDITYIASLSNLGPKELPLDLERILDRESIGDLLGEDFTFAEPKKEYVRLEMSLIGDETGKITIKRKLLSGKVRECEKEIKSRREPCVIDDLQPLSENDFENPCEGFIGFFRSAFTKRCGKHAVERDLSRDVSVNLFIPFTGKEESLSVDELVCSKSREVEQRRPEAHSDICTLNLHPKKAKDHNNPS